MNEMQNRVSGMGFGLLLMLALAGLAGLAPRAVADQRHESPSGETASSGETNNVDVALDEFVIDMPETLPAGPTRFHIVNRGRQFHNLEIEGQGIEKELPEDLAEGESGTLEVDLKPGEYRVYCPVGNHAMRGMDMQLTVTGPPEAAGDRETTPETATPAPTPTPHDHAAHEREPTAEGPGIPPALDVFRRWIGKFHPPTVNFPIALILSAALAELLFALTGKIRFDHVSQFCIRLGTLAAVAAGIFGWCFAGFRLVDDNWILTTHRWLGTSAVAWTLLVFLLGEAARRRPERPRLRSWFRFMLFLGAALVAVTGFFGGAMLYGLDHYAWPA